MDKKLQNANDFIMYTFINIIQFINLDYNFNKYFLNKKIGLKISPCTRSPSRNHEWNIFFHQNFLCFQFYIVLRNFIPNTINFITFNVT